MRKILAVATLLLLATFVSFAPPASALQDGPGINLYLRRATFDPLRAAPSADSAARPGAPSGLLLMQFEAVPTEETRAALEAAGFHPLLYIPTNGLLVRATGARPVSQAALPGLRWTGSFQAAYKLPPDLDPAMSGQATGDPDLQLLAAPDADVDLLARDLAAMGGAVKSRAAGLNGSILRVRLPAATLRAVLDRDDVVWAERAILPRALNDRARAILGVTASSQRFGWLNGAGQLIAVTDTGLDVQASVGANGNPDFAAGRIARGFSRQEMDPADCSGQPLDATWDDHVGHGTHVAGTALGGGRPQMTPSLAGIAPGAGLVVQAVATGDDPSGTLDCLPLDSGFLVKAYDVGARVQNASWGGPTGSGFSDRYGAYTGFDQAIDDFLWSHKDHLLVVAAGNGNGDQQAPAGVVDPDSINSPGTAKNVLTVGSSENYRPPTAATCTTFGTGRPQANQCYGSYGRAPIAADFVSDRVDGIAAFSGRGPADDGRIKPEIVAPGTNIVSTASHDASASYPYGMYDSNYAYDSGTSMSAPLVSGMAALARQWLAQARQISAPSAALVKALLLNGAMDLSPGQYGTGSQREIPAAWPNNVEGWGRAAITDTIGLSGDQDIWLADDKAGLLPGASATYSLTVSAGQPLRISLAWTDYPASPVSARTLVNDLDLEVQPPSGPALRGNATADLPASCRDSATGADRCDNVETVEVAAPQDGVYVVRVRGVAVPEGPQPFALAARARAIADAALGVPALQPIAGGGPALALTWSAIAGATSYQIVESASSDFSSVRRTFTATGTELMVVQDVGTHWFRVRACLPDRCGTPSNAQPATVTSPPWKKYFSLITS